MKQIDETCNFKELYDSSINKKIFIYKYKLNTEQIAYVKKNLVFIFNNPDFLYIDELEDACEISMLIDFYPIQDVIIIKKILNSKVDYFIKLSILSLLFMLSKKIPQNEFLELNKVHCKSTNKLLNFQSKLNLVLYNNVSSEQIIKMLNREKAPTLYYRFLRALAESKSFAKKFNSHKSSILNSIQSEKFNSGVTAELMNLYNKVFN